MTPRTPSADLRAFADVDLAADPAALVRALDVGKASPGMRAVGDMIMRQLRLDDARSVIDIGCGPGIDILTMAARVPEGVRVVGVDHSHSMIAEARRRAADADASVSLTVASATDLPFDDGDFDRARIQSLLLHIPDARQAVGEVARVLRPGGRVVAFEFDLGTTFVDHPDGDTTAKLLAYVAGASHRGRMGRQLPRRFRQAGFADITVTPYVVLNDYSFFASTMRQPLARLVRDGALGARQALSWMEELRSLHEAGEYLGGTTGFVVSAIRA
ncbi:methyltransferase domain-containing protein [Sphaerisporangium rhizosphaerae]|uniref:Methyltransferase domain-containing protein n=1 Tax=Sphaerisporangium rhizosphaerae TaxID=2269375 RepID=A0ABW2PFM1_9ACTN